MIKIKRFALYILFLVAFLGGFKRVKEKVIEHTKIVRITSEDNSKHYMKLFDPNGVSTPNEESFAESGIVFTHALSNTAVCSAARSSLISSCFGPRLASHYHHSIQKFLCQSV